MQGFYDRASPKLEGRLSIFVSFFLCVCVCGIYAQEGEQVFIPVSTDAGESGFSEYIREWLVLGPFFPDDLDEDFLFGAGGEANIEPREGDTFATADGRAVTWKRHRSSGAKIDLLNAVGDHENATAYAFCILESDSEADARVYLGSDDGIAVWINGKRLHRHAVSRALSLNRDVFEVSLEAGANRCMVKVTQGTEAWGFALRLDISPPGYALLSGKTTDETGKPIANASVRLEQDGKEIARTNTDSSGNYSMKIHPARGRYDLFATAGELGGLRLGISLSEGGRRSANLTLRAAVSIEGTLLMLDGKTPHVAVPVQAVAVSMGARMGRPSATALSDEHGKYQLVNLRPGFYRVRCQVPGGYIYYGRGGNSTSQVSEAASFRVGRGRTFRGINFSFAPFKKGTWRNYNYFDGLASNVVHAIHRGTDGIMWVGTYGGGISRYDGGDSMVLPVQSGPEGSWVRAIARAPDGAMWFGTLGGVSRYDGSGIVSFTSKDGLASNEVNAIYIGPDGVLWFGTSAGVSRYDGGKFVTYTTEDGLPSNFVTSIQGDADGNLWFGTFSGGVSRYDGKAFVNFTTRDGLASDFVLAIHSAPDKTLWFGTLGGGVSRYDGTTFVNFTTRDGLANNTVSSIYSDPDGVLWFGTGYLELPGGGVSRYDGRGTGNFPHFVNFTTHDGLANNTVSSIYGGPDGVLWFGTDSGISIYEENVMASFTARDGLVSDAVSSIYSEPDGVLWFGTDDGVSRYDGEAFVTLDEQNGPASKDVCFIHRTPDGKMWLGTRWGGVSYYDGGSFVNLTEKDGLLSNQVWAGHVGPDGVLWFGTYSGVSRYDGSTFLNLTTKDGLPHSRIRAIYRDPKGALWFGTDGGASRYNGRTFDNFTQEDGLPAYVVLAICGEPDGNIWFGTPVGVSRYDGNGFLNFTAQDGLSHNHVRSIYRDSEGTMWFATEVGVSRYDGVAWTSLDTRDGLAGDVVASIHQNSNEYLWFATDGGITRYSPSSTPPKVRIASVRTSEEVYTDPGVVPSVTAGKQIVIEYSAVDFTTFPAKRQYRYRIKEMDQDWSKPTKAKQFEWTPRKSGNYTFEVQAIDRDLNYSDTPASLSVAVSWPPFYRTGIFLIALITIGGVSLPGVIILAVQRRRSSSAEKLRHQEEIERARQMQNHLLPEGDPRVEGFDVAGSCRPAPKVGGDFFDYISLAEKTGIAIADVSDDGLKGAANATLVNNVMHKMATSETSCGKLLSALNTELYAQTETQTFVALGIAIFERDSKTLQWANAAQPYPIVKQGERVFEMKGSSELPLSIMKDSVYRDLEMDLQSGDFVVFYTNGVIKAENETREVYGTARLEQFVREIDPTASAKEMAESIMQDIEGFTGSAEQNDDIAVFVVKKL